MMNKLAIGILDLGLGGSVLFEQLAKKYRYESFIYVSDVLNMPYDGKTPEVINKLVKESLDFLLSQGIKMLLVANDIIVEYCSELLSTVEVPVVNIIESIIDYVNTNYEQKDLILLTKQEIIRANLYQKNFRYNHLFSINSNELGKIVTKKQIKTSESFFICREIFKGFYKRHIDLLIISESYLEKLRTEIKEYLDISEIISLANVFSEKIDAMSDILEIKGKRNLLVASNISKKEFNERTYWLKMKYKYIDVNNIKE